MKKEEVCLFWFRRDFRLHDNVGLFHALSGKYKVLPVFIFDTEILNAFEKPYNLQVEFIYSCILQLDVELKQLNSSLSVAHTSALSFFKDITTKYTVKALYTNEDYELSSIKRDTLVEEFLRLKNIPLFRYKDHVIFGKDEIIKQDGKPYTVFSPYSKKWKQTLAQKQLQVFDCKLYYSNFFTFSTNEMPQLSHLGYRATKYIFPSNTISNDLIKDYGNLRNYPYLDATSHLGIHLRFGTISIRGLVKQALFTGEVFLNELIWRDFYHAITFHFPHICTGLSFKKKYEAIQWLNNELEFAAWCKGETGYPIVDAGMRQLNSTGYMHNRVRMIAASFLVKHLLIDWRWGEVYFQNKLLDFDFAANNGGWQWAGGSGCDAAPYFRIFNPELQMQKFDKNKEYVQKWIPELGTTSYPKPIINHAFARKRALETYRKALE